jgi:hypothetical protein
MPSSSGGGGDATATLGLPQVGNVDGQSDRPHPHLVRRSELHEETTVWTQFSSDLIPFMSFVNMLASCCGLRKRKDSGVQLPTVRLPPPHTISPLFLRCCLLCGKTD